MKKYIITSLTFIIMFFYLSQSALAFTSNSSAAILIDGDTGKILYQKNCHQSLPVASTTKILTALLALEYGKLDKEITVPDDFVNAGETGLALKSGETHTLNDYLYAMMIHSANDCAQMVAYAVSGSEKDFIKLMNEESENLGLQESSWQNPHGLYDTNHYSSAFDLAIIAKKAMGYPDFRQIVAMRQWEIPWQSEIPGNILYNRNKLFYSYEYTTGIKTGYTRQSGNCLVASATKNGMNLIGVLLNSEDMYVEMAEMMDYGFNNFSKKLISKNGDIWGTVKVKNGLKEEVDAVLDGDLHLVLDNNMDSYENEGKVILEESIQAPVEKGTLLGTVTFTDGEGNSVEGQLLAADDIIRYTFWEVVKDIFKQIFRVLIVKG